MALIQSLERRLCLAASPGSVAGLQIYFEIESATGDFDDIGAYDVITSTTDGSYELVGYGVDDSSGTFSYSKTGATTGQMDIVDINAGADLVDVLTFTSDTGGTYVLSNAAGDTQTGTFELVAAPDFAALSGGVLELTGTFDADIISVTLSSGTIHATRNNFTENFTSSGVESLSVSLAGGNDSMTVGTIYRPVYAIGGDGDDTMVGGDNKDTLTGGAGRNRLFGGEGDDRLTGSGGRDFLYGEGGNDRLYGSGGNDQLDGGAGVDRCWGGDGDDYLYGGSSNDKLYGEGGNDSLNGAKGADILSGGAGTDTAYKDATDIVDTCEVNA